MPDHHVQGQSADGQHPKLCGLGLTNGRSRNESTRSLIGHSSAQALRASDAVPEQYPSSLTPHVRHSLQAMALCQMLVERGMDINHGNVAWSNLEVNLQGQWASLPPEPTFYVSKALIKSGYPCLRIGDQFRDASEIVDVATCVPLLGTQKETQLWRVLVPLASWVILPHWCSCLAHGGSRPARQPCPTRTLLLHNMSIHFTSIACLRSSSHSALDPLLLDYVGLYLVWFWDLVRYEPNSPTALQPVNHIWSIVVLDCCSSDRGPLFPMVGGKLLSSVLLRAKGTTCLSSSSSAWVGYVDFSRMRSEGFPFIVGGWTFVRRQLVGASFFASLIRCL